MFTKRHVWKCSLQHYFNIYKLETIQMPISNWIDKLWHSYNGILNSNENGWTTTSHNINESYKQCWAKEARHRVPVHSIHISFKSRQKNLWVTNIGIEYTFSGGIVTESFLDSENVFFLIWMVVTRCIRFAYIYWSPHL